MSSLPVRQEFKKAFTVEFPDLILVDLTLQVLPVTDLKKSFNIQNNVPWIGIEFFGNDELPASLSSLNTSGKFRESGNIIFYFNYPRTLNNYADLMVLKAEEVRDFFRQRRFGGAFVDSITPLQTTGEIPTFHAGYATGAVEIEYRREFTIG